MAMIQCPECGQEISDKAKKCIHCGKVFVEEKPVNEEIKCIECGAVLSGTDEICPNCGCPIEEQKADEPQKVEVTNVKLSVNKKKAKIIRGVAIVVVAAIIAVIGIKFISENNAKKEYVENYEKLIYLILDGASDAESAGGLIHDVWYNTIYEESDSKTDKYTKDSNGMFYDDFNTSLLMLMLSDSFTSDIDDIKSNQEQVQKMMKDMKNPPEGYADAYDALKDFYDAYTKLVNLAVDPSGNLSSYTSEFNEADSETMNTYRAALLYVED
ncbi:MAG: zinc ribbon domain-containing protein [Lachnospiraceae bacterium]|nr:zinc ribbon domain-containing protein [Lachnospiraceae bacterium]